MIKIAVFSADAYTKQFLLAADKSKQFDFNFIETKLTAATVVLARGVEIISCFVNDRLDQEILTELKNFGIKLIALRSAGYNNVDLVAARELGLTIAYVPNYSPYAVAEFTAALILTLNRKIHRAYMRVRDGNFSLHGLIGFDLHGKTVGIIGTGRIGSLFAQIMRGFGCTIIAYDIRPNPACQDIGVQYVPISEIFARANIISLHCPLTPDNTHMINREALTQMREGVMLINTSRGGLIDTRAVIQALKVGKIGALGLDVYEEEQAIFYEDLSSRIITDDLFIRLATFPNVLITSHQGFLTEEAYRDIAVTTLQNIHGFLRGAEFAQVPS